MLKFLSQHKAPAIIFTLLLSAMAVNLSAQPYNLILNREQSLLFEESLSARHVNFHTSIKPWLRPEMNLFLNADSLDNKRNFIGKFIKGFGHYTKSENRVNAALLLTAVPAFGQSDAAGKPLFSSAVGAGIIGHLGKKLSYNANYITANAAYPGYLDNYISSHAIIPGEGFAFGTATGYHHKNGSGYLSYSPSEIFNLQIGHGKNFIGDGYRSLLLSDIANNYSYFRLSATIWKLKYISLFGNFKDIRGSNGVWNNFQNKYGAIHYLSWNLANWLNIGFFEAVIWQGRDSLNSRGFDVQYLNPVIFYRPVEYSIGSSDNSMMGLNIKISPFNKLHMYGQLILDEFFLSEIKSWQGWWANKQGVQAGFKWFDAFTFNNLILQGELNYVRPYTYSHTTRMINYGHFNQPLAHPLGANFKEAVGILRYQSNQWSLEAKMIVAQFGRDTAGISFGGDIYQPYTLRPSEYGHFVGQGLSTNLLINDLTFTYMIFPKLNLVGEAGIRQRMAFSSDNTSDRFLWMGLRTALWNNYHDF